MVFGPGTVSCIQRGDFVACMSETVFGSGPAQIAEAETDSDVTALAEAQGEQPEPAAPAEPDIQEAADQDDATPPSFALVRVEPDGSAVIAGTASPNGQVQIFVGDEQIGTETAEATGDFAFITETPLPAGGVEVRVRDVETDSFAPESVVVVVQDDQTSEPIVIASQPGEASQILQGLDRPQPVAEAEPAPEPERAVVAQIEQPEPDAPTAQEVEAPAAPEPAASEPAAREAQPVAAEEETAPVPAAVVEEQPQAPEPVAPQQAPAVSQPEETPARQVEAEAETLASEPEAASAEPEPAAEQAAPAQDEQQSDLAQEPAATEPAPIVVQPAAIIAQPTIDAIEIDGDLNFFAGAGTDGMTVRLYVDNELVGTSEVADGRWLVEANDALGRATQRVRVDMLDRNGNVVGRAEVDFVLELPETVTDGVVIAEPTPTPPAPAEPAPVQPGEPAAMAPVEDEPEQEAQPAAPVAEPIEPQEPAEPAVAEDAVPTLEGVTEGTRTTSGLAIIRSGDNLWTIARRVYGEGIRYTQIYEANSDQIRDPDLIYPGQVFDLPDTDQVVGRDEDEDEALLPQ